MTKRAIYHDSFFLKRDEYKDEKEWRLIIDGEETKKSYDEWGVLYNWKGMTGKTDDPIRKLIPNALEFMSRNNKIISYLDLKYDIYTDSLPVKKIIIGPNCEVSGGDIFHLLEFYGFDGNEIEIVNSNSSYSI